MDTILYLMPEMYKQSAWLGAWSSVDPASICYVGTSIVPQTFLLSSPIRESLRVLAFHEIRLVKSLVHRLDSVQLVNIRDLFFLCVFLAASGE